MDSDLESEEDEEVEEPAKLKWTSKLINVPESKFDGPEPGTIEPLKQKASEIDYFLKSFLKISLTLWPDQPTPIYQYTRKQDEQRLRILSGQKPVKVLMQAT